ncbi:hypothetical protein SAMN06296065_1024 [Novosphingobium panipatense]|uniref:Uncharacterized protein n=1 Tax=Novosphingobium panipatense TaxID=428991 RepID=A0ABY1Q0Q2_9SPHN|nr:hypothetical protein SAMN06296065_1024 [Novosphingobium panipatense]
MYACFAMARASVGVTGGAAKALEVVIINAAAIESW